MKVAIAREVSGSLADCELTFVAREPIDIDVARRQHAAYVRALEDAGCTVLLLPPQDALPDAVFVEDPVLVLDECAVLLPMGTASRRLEVETLAAGVRQYRPLLRVAGRIEGGDILRIGRDLFVGLSPRTDAHGVEQLTTCVAPFGYRVVPVAISECLHLKTACTYLGDRLLVNPEWVDSSPFSHVEMLRVDPAEPFAANALALADRVLVSAAFPRTERVLRDAGYVTVTLDVSELQKAEAGLTCMSLVFAGHVRDAGAA